MTEEDRNIHATKQELYGAASSAFCLMFCVQLSSILDVTWFRWLLLGLLLIMQLVYTGMLVRQRRKAPSPSPEEA